MRWVWMFLAAVYLLVGISCAEMAWRIMKEELFWMGKSYKDMSWARRTKVWLVPLVGWPWLVYRFRKDEHDGRDA